MSRWTANSECIWHVQHFMPVPVWFQFDRAGEAEKTSDSSTIVPEESFVRRSLRESNPELSEDDLSELGSIM